MAVQYRIFSIVKNIAMWVGCSWKQYECIFIFCYLFNYDKIFYMRNILKARYQFAKFYEIEVN